MRLRSTLITTSLIALLASCGGGGESVEQDRPVVLQSLSLDTTNNVISVEEADSTAFPEWSTTETDNVMKLSNGDIVGMAMDSIPESVEFAATGTADMYILQGSTPYLLEGGDVTGSLSSDATTLTVDLTWTGNEIAVPDEEQSEAPLAMTMNLTSGLSGTTDCGAANLLCGGTVTVMMDGAPLIGSTSVTADEYKAGIYGSTAENAELGGQINYVEQDTVSVIGSFIGGTN
jgi:hypothetical protein